jgi:hypothetical protein
VVRLVEGAEGGRQGNTLGSGLEVVLRICLSRLLGLCLLGV